MFKLIVAGLCVVLGIWLAFNHPDIASMIFEYVMMGFDRLWALIQEYLR